MYSTLYGMIGRAYDAFKKADAEEARAFSLYEAGEVVYDVFLDARDAANAALAAYKNMLSMDWHDEEV